MLNIGIKRMRSLLTAVIALILLGAMIDLGSTSGSTRLYVDPPNATAKVGQTFNVDIMVQDVDDLFTWQILMEWSGSSLKCNRFTYGNFMQQAREGSVIGSDAPAGQKNVTVAGYIDRFSAGESVRIYDDFNSENNKIESIIGYRLIMQNNLANTYTVAAHGKVDTYPGTSKSSRIEPSWLMCGEMTSLPSAGADGSGWLATIQFQVLAETATVLNMSKNYPAYTYLLDSMGVDIEIPGGPEDGRYLPPWKEDINVDGSIDIFDISSIGIDWGRYCGSIRRNATSSTAGWTDPSYAYTSNDAYATCTSAVSSTWKSYGFVTTGWTGVSKVEVGFERKTDSGGDEKVKIEISNDGGTSFSTAVTYTVTVSETTDTLTWYDFTGAYAWAPGTPGVANVAVKLTSSKTGGTFTKVYVDWLPVRVTPLPQTYSPYTDLNGDHIVDTSDLSMVAVKFGEQYAG